MDPMGKKRNQTWQSSCCDSSSGRQLLMWFAFPSPSMHAPGSPNGKLLGQFLMLFWCGAFCDISQRGCLGILLVPFMFFLLVQWYIDEFQEIIHLDEHIFSAEKPLGIETFCMMSKVKYFTNQGNTGIPLMSSLGSKCEQTRHIIVTQKRWFLFFIKDFTVWDRDWCT